MEQGAECCLSPSSPTPELMEFDPMDSVGLFRSLQISWDPSPRKPCIFGPSPHGNKSSVGAKEIFLWMKENDPHLWKKQLAVIFSETLHRLGWRTCLEGAFASTCTYMGHTHTSIVLALPILSSKSSPATRVTSKKQAFSSWTWGQFQGETRAHSVPE